MARATGLIIFHLLLPKRCLLAYRSTCNAFFRDLPVSSFVFHSFLLTVKSIDLVVACDCSLCIMEIIYIFHNCNKLKECKIIDQSKRIKIIILLLCIESYHIIKEMDIKFFIVLLWLNIWNTPACFCTQFLWYPI